MKYDFKVAANGVTYIPSFFKYWPPG